MKKKQILYIQILLLLIGASLNLFSQIDSLKLQLKIAKTDTGKINIYNSLASKLLHENVTEAFAFAFKSSSLSKKINYEKGLAESYSVIGNLHSFNSTDSSLYYLFKSLSIRLKLKDFKGVAALYTSVGTSYDKLGNSDLALKNYFKSLTLFDSLSIDKGSGGASLGLGNVFSQLKQYKKAIEYYQKSIDSYKKINSPYLSWALNNLANIYEKTNDREKAKVLYKESLKLKLESKDYYGAVFTMDNLGVISLRENKKEEALSYFYSALKINRENGLEIETFANSYKNICDALLQINKNDIAKLYLDSLHDVTSKLNSFELRLDYLNLNCNYYKNIHDYKSALIFKELYLELKDSFLINDMNKQVAEADAKYKTEKKERQIELLNKDKVIQQTEIAKQQTQRNGFVVGLFLLICLLIFIFKSYLQKQKANKLITKQKQEVERQKHIVEEHQKETLDSIHYAKRIQTALLPNQGFIDSHFSQNFILFKPKDIVSGDFYWTTEHDNKFYLAVCDCTGHGVPGAFMSLLNMGFLSEAIKEKNITEPGEIFNYVRERLITSISSDGQQDGMDGILLCIDKSTNQLTYAAANNDPILISNGQIIELPKDKMPVGKGERTDSFKTNSIVANKGDTLYLYTDGYADQFGGPKGKKFKYKQLNTLLIEINSKTMAEQNIHLDNTIENWKDNLEQVDDILIIGIKL